MLQESLLLDDVNEYRILTIVQQLYSEHLLDQKCREDVREWIRRNKERNSREEEPYQTWVWQIYSKIECLLSA